MLDDTTGNYGMYGRIISFNKRVSCASDLKKKELRDVARIYGLQIRVDGYYVQARWKAKLAQRKDGLREYSWIYSETG